MAIISQETLKQGDKYRITSSIMSHLIGKVVTIKNYKGTSKGNKWYNVTIDDMNGSPLVCSDKTLEKV